MKEPVNNKSSATAGDFDTSGGSTLLEDERLPDTSAQLSPPVVPPVTRAMVGEAGPRRGGLWASLLYALCTMALGYPALNGQFWQVPTAISTSPDTRSVSLARASSRQLTDFRNGIHTSSGECRTSRPCTATFSIRLSFFV
jgi:hypothetical protein